MWFNNPSKIMTAVKKYKAHVGISFDGDADRIIMCDENRQNYRWRSNYCNACSKMEI